MTNTPEHTLEGHKSWVMCVAWSPDGKMLVSGGHDGTVRLWDPETGKKVGSLAFILFFVIISFFKLPGCADAAVEGMKKPCCGKPRVVPLLSLCVCLFAFVCLDFIIYIC